MWDRLKGPHASRSKIRGGGEEGGKGREEEFWLGENITMTSVHE